MRRQPSVGTQPSQHDLSKQSQLSSLVLPSFSVKNLYKLHCDESEAVFKKKDFYYFSCLLWIYVCQCSVSIWIVDCLNVFVWNPYSCNIALNSMTFLCKRLKYDIQLDEVCHLLKALSKYQKSSLPFFWIFSFFDKRFDQNCVSFINTKGLSR